MSARNLILFLEWWCEVLVRALLRGAWRHVLERAGTAQDAAFARFENLVNAADCWPCYVSWCHPARNVPDRETGAMRPALVIVADPAGGMLTEEWS